MAFAPHEQRPPNEQGEPLCGVPYFSEWMRLFSRASLYSFLKKGHKKTLTKP